MSYPAGAWPDSIPEPPPDPADGWTGDKGQCQAMVYSGRRWVDPEPPEYCEAETVDESVLYCPAHAGDDEDW